LSTGIQLLTQIAPEFGGVCTQSSDTAGVLDLPIRLVDGRTIPFILQIWEVAGSVSVRESSTHLPPFCPERHINSDGTFCLNYSPAYSLEVLDECTARAWMETLYKFLKLQERARVLRRWPNSDGWAHGDAAHHQRRAETALASLGGKWGISQNSLTVRSRVSKGRALLELFSGNNCMYRVWESSRKVVNQRRRCFCEAFGRRRPKTIKKCSDHAAQAAELVFALRDWIVSEKQYWDTMRGKSCCGTCDACPLQSNY